MVIFDLVRIALAEVDKRFVREIISAHMKEKIRALEIYRSSIYNPDGEISQTKKQEEVNKAIEKV